MGCYISHYQFWCTFLRFMIWYNLGIGALLGLLYCLCHLLTCSDLHGELFPPFPFFLPNGPLLTYLITKKDEDAPTRPFIIGCLHLLLRWFSKLYCIEWVHIISPKYSIQTDIWFSQNQVSKGPSIKDIRFF